MARRYYLSSSASNITSGTLFNLSLLPNVIGAADSVTVTLASGVTVTGSGFTPPLHPGTSGRVSSYTTIVEVSTGAAQIQISVIARRVNSAGAIQTSSAPTAEQTANVGPLTFTLANTNLGTWAAGDRLQLDYLFRNNQAHGGDRTAVIVINTLDVTVAAEDWIGRKSRAT